MSQNPVDDRKEAKPKKVFTIEANLFDDSVMAGKCIEYRDCGRFKNQKCLVLSHDDFIASVRSLTPGAVQAIEPLVQKIFEDIEITDTEECEKIGHIVVDIYNDNFISCDLGEVIKGPRGAPKTWRMEPRDFLDMVQSRVGQLTAPFTPLIENTGFATINTTASTAYIGDVEDVDSDEEEVEDKG